MRFSRVAAILVLFAPLASSQTEGHKGVLSGTALDSHQHAAAAIRLYVKSDGQAPVISSQTDAKGNCRISLSSGRYTLRGEKADGSESGVQSFTIQAGKVTTLVLRLEDAKPPEAQFFDEPKFTVAGVKNDTYRGGHGSDSVLRSSEDLTRATVALDKNAGKTDSAEPHHARAEEYEQFGHPVAAAKEFQAASELNPSERNLFDWGTVLLSHRSPAVAAQVYAKGYRLYPESTRMVLGLAAAHYAQGLYKQAAEWFFKATDILPNDAMPYLFLGKVRAGEITELRGYQERMARFAQLHSDDAFANYYYGLACWNQSKRTGDKAPAERAKALFTKALSISPHFAEASLQLGIIYASEQNDREAIRAYRRAIEDKPDSEEAHYRLSQIYRSTGDRNKSAAELATYKRLVKQSSEKVEHERQQVQQFVIELRKTAK